MELIGAVLAWIVIIAPLIAEAYKRLIWEPRQRAQSD